MLGKQLIGYGNIQIHIKDEVKKDDTMKLIKNMLLFVLSLVLCFALSPACGSNNTVEHKSSAAEEEDRKETTSAEKTSEDTEETTRADEDGKNILVAYFSLYRNYRESSTDDCRIHRR